MDYVTVSAKINKELYKKIKKYNIRISKIIREALEREVKIREEQELEAALDKVQKILLKIPPHEIVENIRNTRDER